MVMLHSIFTLSSPPLVADAVTLLNTSAEISERVAKAWDDMWELALDGTLYQVMCNAGVLIAVTCLLFFMMNFAKQWLQNEGNNWVLAELLWPILVILLLANGGSNLATLTLGLRNVIGHYNVLILDAISDEVEFTEVMSQLADYSTAVNQLAAEREQCNAIVNNEELQQCLEFNTIRAKAILDEYRDQHPRATEWIEDLQARIELASENPMEAIDLATDAVGFVANPLGQLSVGFMGNAVTGAIEIVLIASQAAFQLIIEASLLLTGLIGPLALGASLLPFGAKPIYAWITGFFSLGMCKLCLNLITGLVAISITSMPPIDTLPTALVIGFFAPILAFALSAGGGMAIFSGLTSAGGMMSSLVMGGVTSGVGLAAGAATQHLVGRQSSAD